MGFFQRLFGRSTASNPPVSSAQQPPKPPPDPEPDEVTVPEISVVDLQSALQQGEPLVVLDVRENYEWAQGHLPTAAGWDVVHMPMNSIPSRLGDLPRDRTVAVLCAHGNRSYSVTHYLNEQGFRARNVTGGIARWAQSGGKVER
jgi:rhodanese-related sulfurtransferase